MLAWWVAGLRFVFFLKRKRLRLRFFAKRKRLRLRFLAKEALRVSVNVDARGVRDQRVRAVLWCAVVCGVVCYAVVLWCGAVWCGAWRVARVVVGRWGTIYKPETSDSQGRLKILKTDLRFSRQTSDSKGRLKIINADLGFARQT